MPLTSPPHTAVECWRGELRLPAGLHDELRAVARRNDRTVQAEVRTAIRAHVRRELGSERPA